MGMCIRRDYRALDFHMLMYVYGMLNVEIWNKPLHHMQWNWHKNSDNDDVFAATSQRTKKK